MRPFELSWTAAGCDQHLPLSGMPLRARKLSCLLKSEVCCQKPTRPGLILFAPWGSTLHPLRKMLKHLMWIFSLNSRGIFNRYTSFTCLYVYLLVSLCMCVYEPEYSIASILQILLFKSILKSLLWTLFNCEWISGWYCTHNPFRYKPLTKSGTKSSSSCT